MKTINEINNKGMIKIEELKKFGSEWVNELEKQAIENKNLYLPNLHISGWIIKNFNLNIVDLKKEEKE